tara:strand:- start:173 stop:382 length:210 start_codon:yes stop_codon:yes gene_type:complete
MKNFDLGIRDKLVRKYLERDKQKNLTRKTDINVLLNRVKINQKKESRNKIYFSAVVSTSLLVFSFLIFA